MPRLFTGLEIPQTHQTALSLLQSGLPGVRWIDPGDFHITLRFIGDVSPKTADNIVDALSARSWQAPTIALGELKHFGGATPRAVFSSVQDDPVLSSLVATQERLFQDLGLAAEGRKFTPHITLARCKGIKDEKLARYLGEKAGHFKPPAFKPSRFNLYSARQSRGGGPYFIEHSWAFGH